MANISRQLSEIMSAIYGRDVRRSIHDAIDEINIVSELTFTLGSEDPEGTARYSGLLYLNTETDDLFKSIQLTPGAAYTWTRAGNLQGNSIVSIEKTGTNILIDTYTITFSKADPITFEITNGNGISEITGPVTDGLTDTYTIHYTNGTDKTFEVENGNGIENIELTDSTGTIDTYTITFTNGSTFEYNVDNGNRIFKGTAINGKYTTSFVSQGYVDDYCRIGDTYINKESGDVYTCTKNGFTDNQGDVPDPGKALWIYEFTLIGGGGSTDNTYALDDPTDVEISDEDFFPYFDVSANTPKRTLWQNIKAKLKFYFDSVYQTQIGDLTELETTDKDNLVDAINEVAQGSGGETAWGSITGTLSDQTDLNTALGNKADSSSAYLTGDTAETDIANDDYIPFYDTSESAKRKSLWSNIKSVLKTYFDTLYSTVKTRGTPTSGGTTLSLVTTGDMYTWNNKSGKLVVEAKTSSSPISSIAAGSSGTANFSVSKSGYTPLLAIYARNNVATGLIPTYSSSTISSTGTFSLTLKNTTDSTKTNITVTANVIFVKDT